MVKTIDQQHLKTLRWLAHKGGTISLQHLQAQAVRWDLEGLAQRDHMRVDLDHTNVAAGQVLVAELGQ